MYRTTAVVATLIIPTPSLPATSNLPARCTPREEQWYLAFRFFLILLWTTFHILHLFVHFLFHLVFHSHTFIWPSLLHFVMLFMLVPLLLSLRHNIRPAKHSPKN